MIFSSCKLPNFMDKNGLFFIINQQKFFYDGMRKIRKRLNGSS